MLPEEIKNFVDAFSELPSIGPRQATRLAFYITSLGKGKIAQLTKQIQELQNLETCPSCFFISIDGCSFCSDKKRFQNIVCIIEKETDLLSLEKTKKYHGVYLVLGPLPRTGALTAEQRTRLASLRQRAPLEEIILAISPTAYGDLNAALIAREIKSLAKKVTRLGRGIPTGGEIEFADPDTLSSALDNRS